MPQEQVQWVLTLIAGTEQDYVFPLVGVTLLMLFISAYRIWRWQPSVGQPA